MEKTIKNLAAAFIGESQARNRYTFYAKVAKKEGFEQISDIFLATAENEREHAKWLLIMLNQLLLEKEKTGCEVKTEAEVPTVLGNTADNLKASIEGERYENTKMYPSFAKIALEEGLPEIAGRLKSISKAEEHHEKRFIALLTELEGNSIFKKEADVDWVCKKCGYVYKSKTPPEKCPSCDHPPSYFEVKCEAY
jgi:rubrerythrin